MTTVTLDGVDEVIATTQKAVLVAFKDGRETWVPRAVCDNGDDLAKGDADIVVQEWFAKREGLD